MPIKNHPPVLLLYGCLYLFVISSCTGNPSSRTQTLALATTPSRTIVRSRTPYIISECNGQLRWFISLDLGTAEDQLKFESNIVRQFNRLSTCTEIIMEVVQPDIAKSILLGEMNEGIGPDIVGPISRGIASHFADQWLDLTPLIGSWKGDSSLADEFSLSWLPMDRQALADWPIMLNPSVLYFNRALFAKAGLNPLPSRVGELYQMPDGTQVEWNMDTLAAIARLLTLDANGNNADSPRFNPGRIIQFGFLNQEPDLLEKLTLFGAGTLAHDDAKIALMPSQWRTGLDWYYRAIWQDHTYPELGQVEEWSQAGIDPFSTGKVVMAVDRLSYMLDSLNNPISNLGYAVVPSYAGHTSASVPDFGFRIWNGSKHPKEAFDALVFLGRADWISFGSPLKGIPVQKQYQETYFHNLESAYAERYFGRKTIEDMVYYSNFADEFPSLPNSDTAQLRIDAFSRLIQSTPNLDLNKEIDKLIADLQSIFTGP
jgi:multiple sugar transport system substrate-binding protein